MRTGFVGLATAVSVAVLAVVGFIDAIRDDHTGTAVLFALILAGVSGLAGSRPRAGSLVLRRDLASWLDRTSSVTGESPDELANRAVSRLRAGFGAADEERP